MANGPVTRDEVYGVIDGEIAYAAKKWGVGGANHEIASWITYMRHYLNLAERAASTNSPEDPALHEIRKVVALGVVALQQHGAPAREQAT